MQEIKFRVWDKKHKKISLVDAIDFEHDEIYGKNGRERYTPKPFKDIELMQYTGMTDKNGKEIYEGDIVEAWSEGIKARGKIKRRIDGLWLMYPAWQNGTTWSLAPDKDGGTTVLVIGNIYENPELMEVSNDK